MHSAMRSLPEEVLLPMRSHADQRTSSLTPLMSRQSEIIQHSAVRMRSSEQSLPPMFIGMTDDRLCWWWWWWWS